MHMHQGLWYWNSLYLDITVIPDIWGIISRGSMIMGKRAYYVYDVWLAKQHPD